MLASYPPDRLHNQHPPPSASRQSGQPIKPPIGGSILHADDAPQGVNFARRNTDGLPCSDLPSETTGNLQAAVNEVPDDRSGADDQNPALDDAEVPDPSPRCRRRKDEEAMQSLARMKPGPRSSPGSSGSSAPADASGQGPLPSHPSDGASYTCLPPETPANRRKRNVLPSKLPWRNRWWFRAWRARR